MATENLQVTSIMAQEFIGICNEKYFFYLKDHYDLLKIHYIGDVLNSYVFTEPFHHKLDVTQGKFLKQNTVALNLKFFNILDWMLSYFLISGVSRDGSRPSPSVLVWSEIHTASSRIWTQFTDSISCNDNHLHMIF